MKVNITSIPFEGMTIFYKQDDGNFEKLLVVDKTERNAEGATKLKGACVIERSDTIVAFEKACGKRDCINTQFPNGEFNNRLFIEA